MSSSQIDLRRLSRRIITQAIRDIGTGSERERRNAVMFAVSDDFETHLQRAEYPEELSSAMQEMVLRSKAQRRGLAREIIEVLNAHWR